MTEQVTPKVNQIPAMLLTGFLGAGKTTLLRALWSLPDAGDTAVIVNELGEIGLDHHLLAGASETTYLLENGCVCCTQRDDLEASLEDLFWARLRQEIPQFSRVVVETTGLADPAGVFAMVTGDTLAGARYTWNSVVTLVDGQTGSKTLEDHSAAAQQAAMADHMIISKADVAAAEMVDDLRRRLQILKSDARLHYGHNGAVDVLLDALMQPAPGADSRRGGLSGAPLHDAGITSCWLQFRAALPPADFDAAFADLAGKFGADLLRAKGIAHFSSEPKPSVLQYVAGGGMQITPTNLSAEAPSGLVVIASKVSPGAVEDIFAAHGLGPYLVAKDHKGHAH